MVRYMADSVDCTQIPAAIILGPISLRAGYVNGSYHDSSTRCGHTDVLIDVAGTIPSADVLDVENGDATPDTAPGWAEAHNRVSQFPAVIYCNRGSITAIANAMQAAGLVVGKDYRWWIATLDGTVRVADMTGVVAVQVWGARFFPGHNIDVSIVYDDTWKPAPVPPPPPPPPPPPAPHPSPFYRVMSGDTLTSIAAHFHVTVADLVRWNNIPDPNHIVVGEILVVAGSGRTPVYYRVIAGDSLTSISVHFGVSVANLVQWNHISDPNLIRVGELLIVGWRS